MKIIIFVISIFYFSSCIKESDLCHKTIVVHNASNQDIYIQRNYDYPDTIGYNLDMVRRAHSTSKALAGTSNNRALYSTPNGICWETLIRNKDYSKTDTLIVFIYDGRLIDSLADEQSLVEWKDELLLQRYDLSLSDLRKLDFQLYYPATEGMRELKMYPPYQP